MPRVSISSFSRRIVNSVLGQGPWRMAPFNTIAEAHSSDLGEGVHRPERFTGLLRREIAAPLFYKAPHSLLQQELQMEPMSEGPRYRPTGLCCPPPKELYSMSHAGLLGTDGLVYCPTTRQAVAETVRCWTKPALNHPILGAFRFPKAQKLPGLSLSLASLDSTGFYHFLLEALPRLWLARDYLDRVDRVLVTGARDPVREAWLLEAGISSERIHWLEAHSHYHCEQLLFTNIPLHDCQPCVWNREAVRQLFKVQETDSPAPQKHIWISRADASLRNLRWEDRILCELPQFNKVSLTKLSPREQIRLFSEAAVVAGPHGAGFSNLVFMPPGGRVIELFPHGNLLPLYSRLARTGQSKTACAMVDFMNEEQLQGLVRNMNTFIGS